MNWGLNQNWTVIRKLKCKTLEKCQAIKFLKHPSLTGHLNGPGRWTATPMKNLFCQEWKVIRTGQFLSPIPLIVHLLYYMIVHLTYVNRYTGFKLQTKFIRDVNGAYKSLQIS